MSGATLFAFPRPPAQGPLEKRLALEDNRPLVRSVGAGQVIGAWIIAWALTTETPIPRILVDYPETVIVEPDIEPPITFDERPRDKQGKPVKVRPHGNQGPKATARNPSKENGQLQVKVVGARTGDATRPALDILGDIMKSVDMEKIDAVAKLVRTEPTRLAGRKGAKRDEFNPGYSDGDGTREEIDLRAASTLGRIDGGGPKDFGRPVANSSAIEVSSEGRFRSSESILAVVRSHSPGLRHLYNTHLKAYPGLSGKVTVRFAISPSGLVVDAAVDRGTTGSPAFERDVLAKIRSWRFDPIKALGNDIVTVPFNFSE